MNKTIIRGYVYWVKLDPTIGSEIQKTRPAIIVSNNIQNEFSSRLIVIPVSSNINKIFSFEVKVMINNKESKALIDQIRTIDKSRLGSFIGVLSNNEMSSIDRIMRITLNLN